MFLPLWAPSRLSFSLINSRPPQSNRCYGSNPSKLKKKKQKTQSQGPSQLFHILTACPKRNTVSKNRAHGKQGPPLPPPPIPPLPQRQPSYSSPSSPQTSKTILVQLSKVTALAAFRSVSKLFAPFCLHRICGLTPLFLFSCRPSCDQASPLADTPTAKMTTG